MNYPFAYPVAHLICGKISSVKASLSRTEYYSAEHSIYTRLSPAGLARLEHQLSTRDLEIIKSVELCKLLSSDQIRRLHFPGSMHSSSSTAERNCRRVLIRLTKLGLLSRMDRSIGGLSGGSRSYIYGLGLIGARLVGRSKVVNYSSKPSPYFAKHTLAIAEIYTQLNEQSNRDNLDIGAVQTEPNCWRSFTYGYGVKQILKPDLYVRINRLDKAEEYSWFIEMDMGTTRLSSVLLKAQIYQRYYQTQLEQKKNKVFPRVIWIVPDKPRQENLIKLFKPINKLVPRLNLVVVTADALGVLTRDLDE
jgi:hypothetical protein